MDLPTGEQAAANITVFPRNSLMKFIESRRAPPLAGGPFGTIEGSMLTTQYSDDSGLLSWPEAGTAGICHSTGNWCVGAAWSLMSLQTSGAAGIWMVALKQA
jgi:hypothetical protein